MEANPRVPAVVDGRTYYARFFSYLEKRFGFQGKVIGKLIRIFLECDFNPMGRVWSYLEGGLIPVVVKRGFTSVG